MNKEEGQQAADLGADALIELVALLEAVDLTSPLAELNTTTISDNNGGRIEL